MATPLKDYYSEDFLKNYAQVLKNVFPSFKSPSFLNQVFSDDWKILELKQRMRKISERLATNLPGNFSESIKILISSIDELERTQFKHHGFEFMFIPDFISLYGLEHYPISIKAIERVTQFITCEFAVRPFIVKYPDTMMPQMLQWSTHENKHLRRLSSEGSRPRLPWAMALPAFKQDPNTILPILEQLKTDDSEYVRRSVANNLNDIAKDHPQLVLDISKKWYGKNEPTNALVKHALRTLLKANYPGALELIGYGSPKVFQLNQLSLTNAMVKEGTSVEFAFSVQNTSSNGQLLRMEYAVYFLLSNQKHTRKVFKISERNMTSKQSFQIIRKHSFRYISTRKYYKGEHFIAPIINGIEKNKLRFELI